MLLELKPSFVVSAENKSFLPNTGFDDVGEAAAFKREAKEFGVETALQNRVENIKAFWEEFLIQSPVLKINIAIDSVNGQKRIICPKYGGVLWLDMVSTEERNGAVWDTVARLEQEIVKAPTGTTFVMSSPPGDSGMVRFGERVIHKDTQTYICEVKDGELRALTLRTNMSLKGNREFFERYEVYVKENAELILRSAFKTQGSVEEVLLEMEMVIGRQSELQELLSNIDSMATTTPEVEEITGEFLKLARANPQNVQCLMADTIKKLWSYKKHGVVKEDYNSPKALEEIQELEGCSWSGGGGNKIKLVDGKRILCCTCLLCGESVEAEISRGYIKCPKCGQKRPWML